MATAGLIPLLALSHGWFLIFSLPLNVLVAAPVAASNRRGACVVDCPGSVLREDMSKFARFPQGLPEGTDLKELSQITTEDLN